MRVSFFQRSTILAVSLLLAAGCAQDRGAAPVQATSPTQEMAKDGGISGVYRLDPARSAGIVRDSRIGPTAKQRELELRADGTFLLLLRAPGKPAELEASGPWAPDGDGVRLSPGKESPTYSRLFFGNWSPSRTPRSIRLEARDGSLAQKVRPGSATFEKVPAVPRAESGTYRMSYKRSGFAQRPAVVDDLVLHLRDDGVFFATFETSPDIPVPPSDRSINLAASGTWSRAGSTIRVRAFSWGSVFSLGQSPSRTTPSEMVFKYQEGELVGKDLAINVDFVYVKVPDKW